MMMLEMMYMMQAQVCDFISAYPWLPYGKTKRETGDVSWKQKIY